MTIWWSYLSSRDKKGIFEHCSKKRSIKIFSSWFIFEHARCVRKDLSVNKTMVLTFLYTLLSIKICQSLRVTFYNLTAFKFSLMKVHVWIRRCMRIVLWFEIGSCFKKIYFISCLKLMIVLLLLLLKFHQILQTNKSGKRD